MRVRKESKRPRIGTGSSVAQSFMATGDDGLRARVNLFGDQFRSTKVSDSKQQHAMMALVGKADALPRALHGSVSSSLEIMVNEL